MVLLFVEWDDGSGVGMILNGCEEFCETSIELDVCICIRFWERGFSLCEESF